MVSGKLFEGWVDVLFKYIFESKKDVICNQFGVIFNVIVGVLLELIGGFVDLVFFNKILFKGLGDF